MAKNLFITGISGFIGRHVARAAIQRGYNVSGIDIKPYEIEGARIIMADITNKAAVQRAIRGADYVIHLAAITSNVPFREVLEGSYNVNVGGFINVIDAAAKIGCKRFVYASSSAVYPNGTRKFSEDTVIDVKKQDNHYAKTKLINETIASSYEDIYKMKTIGLRYFNTYGPTGEKKDIGVNIINMYTQNKRDHDPLVIYGDGKQARDFMYVDDAVYLTLGILEKGKDSIYNIGSGKATSFLELAKIIDPEHIKFIPNPLPASQYQYYTSADTTRLLKLFKGFKFIDIKEGIKRSDFIRIAMISIAKSVSSGEAELTEYANELAANLQPLINGKVDLISALEQTKQNDIGGILYLHTFLKGKASALTHSGYDVIHITNQEIGFLAKVLKNSGTKAKIVTTIYDLTRLRAEHYKGSGVLQKGYNELVKSSIMDALEYSDHIIFKSEQTHKELKEIIGEIKNYSVVPLGESTARKTLDIYKKIVG